MSIIIVVGSFAKDDNSCDRTLVVLVKSMGRSQTRQRSIASPMWPKPKSESAKTTNKTIHGRNEQTYICDGNAVRSYKRWRSHQCRVTVKSLFVVLFVCSANNRGRSNIDSWYHVAAAISKQRMHPLHSHVILRRNSKSGYIWTAT